MNFDKEEKVEQKHTAVNIVIYPKSLFKKLLYCIIFLLIANSMGIVSRIYLGHDYCFGLVPMFDFDAEMNLPTFYSSFILLFSSVLFGIIAFCHKRAGGTYWAWGGLAVIFLFLSIDEFCSLHERLGEPFLRLIKISGFIELSKIFFYAWVIPYGVLLISFVIIYSKFLLNLPRKTMILLIISGVMYVTGAIGLEILSGIQDRLHGTENLTYLLLATVEEMFEMTGVTVLIYTLLSYIRDQFQDFSVFIKKIKSK